MKKHLLTSILFILFSFSGFCTQKRIAPPDLAFYLETDSTLLMIAFYDNMSQAEPILFRPSPKDTTTLDIAKCWFNVGFYYLQDYKLPKKIYLSEEKASELVQKTNLVFTLLDLENETVCPQSPELIKKYGVQYVSAKNVVSQEDESQKRYYATLNLLLTLRNGSNWKEEYEKDKKTMK